MKLLYPITSILLLFFSSCKKEKVIDGYPDFQGTWFHYETYESGVRHKELRIQSDSKGDIWYSNGWKVYGGTQTRKWVIKNDYLYFGWVATGNEKFKIDQYPTVADSAFIQGLDTVMQGSKYIILDGVYFYCDW